MSAPATSALIRALLYFTALVLLSLALWFLGPLVALGDAHPWSTVGLRVTTIVLLLVFVILLLLDWSVSVVGVAALSLLIWHAGPLLAFGGLRPLEPPWVRAAAIGVLLLGYLLWGLYTLWHLIRHDEAFAQRLFARDNKQAKALARDEIRGLAATAQKAVRQLRQMHLTVAGGTGSVVAGLRRLVEGKRYLYDLPWYMIIGAPGTGKTTVLLNAGLKLPLAEQMSAASAQMTLAQHQGTLNCAWWFTNEGVLIDTAGRYTQHDDGAAPTASASPDGPVAVPDSTQLNQAEWLGFLGVLRQVRTRAPINGALLAVDVGELLQSDASGRLAHAARLRARLLELRTELGIRFPVYVLLTKSDLLHGFVDYFSSLTTEARAQVWGFTLPHALSDTEELPAVALSTQLLTALQALHRRVADGVAVRLQEEFELDKRQALYVLPHELQALIPLLTNLLEGVFADSRFDTTQMNHMLRGVYFTSAQQFDGHVASADQRALVPRLWRALQHGTPHRSSEGTDPSSLASAPERPPTAAAPTSARSYFITDALSRVIFPEAHLVKPNLKWEMRFRLLRLLGHALVFTVFAWLGSALLLSYRNNRDYLADVSQKTEQLALLLKHRAQADPDAALPPLLNAAQTLATHSGLDLADPSSTYLYGLYTADTLSAAARRTYVELQDRLVLPIVTHRVETVVRRALATSQAKLAFDSLRVYLLLHDPQHFQSQQALSASDLRTWVMKDWQNEAGAREAASTVLMSAGLGAHTPSQARNQPTAPTSGEPEPGLAQLLGNQTAMIGHLEALFSGERVVQSATGRDEALVRQARAFLDTQSTSERLYDRTKSALVTEAPQDFSLVKVLGPRAGTLFRRQSGTSMERGIPGLFTYDGYHGLFAKRLSELITLAQQDDAWVMGRSTPRTDTKASTDALVEDIRRQYLSEYSRRWTEFLEDIRVVAGTTDGSSLSFELNVLRQLASADSPLLRLGRLAARETTLSRPLVVTGEEQDKSVFDKASEKLDQKVNAVNRGLGLRPEQRLERQLVDESFSALREVVTGQSDGAPAAASGKPALDNIATVLNEYYTALVVADTAVSAGSLPPSSTEAATKVKIEAGKLPAPFREVLLGVSHSGSDKIAQGAASILQVQARAQLDRIQAAMALLVSEPCRRTLAGRYPFATSTQEVAVEDFNSFFASGGAADEFFAKYLQPWVDTSQRPWHYKSPVALGAQSDLASGEGAGASARSGPPADPSTPTLAGELLKLLGHSGPDPDAFAQVARVREIYFREPGAKRMAWKMDMRVQSLDPNVTELVLDLDGQGLRYSHGPLQNVPLQWPGPRGGTLAEISAAPRIRPDTSTLTQRGPWALQRLMERGTLIPSASAGHLAVEFNLDGRRALLDFNSAGTNPLAPDTLRGFKCPGKASL